MSDESSRTKLERECADIQEFLMRFPRDVQFLTETDNLEWTCTLYAEKARAIRKALRLGLAEMAKLI